MRRRLFLLLFLLETVLAGCSRPEQPEPDNLPDIPPGRSNPQSAHDGPQGQTNPVPTHPRQ